MKVDLDINEIQILQEILEVYIPTSAPYVDEEKIDLAERVQQKLDRAVQDNDPE